MSQDSIEAFEPRKTGTPKEVASITLTAASERVRIETLTILDGVSWPTASVILHFFHQKHSPDAPVLRLGRMTSTALRGLIY
jgi:hypothetical protein